MNRGVGDLAAALAVGGETGQLIARTDWDRSPLGPMRSWPERLKAAVSIAMRSTFAMHISWGPELYQFYNDAYRPVLGATKHSAIGLPLRTTFPEAFDSFILPRFNVALNEGHSYTADDELFPIDRHGWLEESHFRFTYDPLGDDDGHIAGVLTICIEITQQVLDHRRLELLTQLEAIAMSAPDRDTMVDQSVATLATTPDTPFAMLLEKDGKIVHCSGLASATAHVGRDIAELVTLADDTGRVQLSDLNIEAQPSPSWPTAPSHAWVGRLDDHLLVLGLHPGLTFDDGYRRYTDLIASALRAAGQRLQRVAELNDHVTALRQLDELKDALLSDVSHELRTPLMLISGAVEELGGRWRDPADLELLATASRASERLRRLVDGLMVYGQLTGGHLTANLVPTDLGHAVADCCDAFAREIERSGLVFEVEAPVGEVMVRLDAHLWQTVLYNLLANALRFTHTGAITVRIAADAADTVAVEVSDTGVGIPVDEHPRLFDRFHRVHGQQGRTEEGAGLGLALVAEIVQRHRGTVTVDSEPGAGTTFTIRLPRSNMAADAGQTQASDTATGDTQAGDTQAGDTQAGDTQTGDTATGDTAIRNRVATRQFAAPAASDNGRAGVAAARILIAEDNVELRQMLSRALGATWQIEAVGNGREALDALGRRAFDLVVTDAMMPMMDGPALIAQLRADPATSHVPVLLLTGRNNPTAAGRADEILHKPFPLAQLVDTVTQLLHRVPDGQA